MECQSIGLRKYWSVGIMDYWCSQLQYSNTPIILHSKNPAIHHSIFYGLRVRRSPLWLFPESLSSRLFVFSVFGGVLAGAPESAGLAIVAVGAGAGAAGVLTDEGDVAGSSGRLWRRRSKGRFFCPSSGVLAFPFVLSE
jgi:hypothetical protein